MWGRAQKIRGVFNGLHTQCDPEACGGSAIGIRRDDETTTYVCAKQIGWVGDRRRLI